MFRRSNVSATRKFASFPPDNQKQRTWHCFFTSYLIGLLSCSSSHLTAVSHNNNIIIIIIIISSSNNNKPSPSLFKHHELERSSSRRSLAKTAGETTACGRSQFEFEFESPIVFAQAAHEEASQQQQQEPQQQQQ